ncbi:hypothetical protein GCM10010378_10220 [Streptomyces viridochromogenes]
MKRKPCFRAVPRRSVGCACPSHPAVTALPARKAAARGPDHRLTATAQRAGDDPLHTHQDRRTT